MSATVASAIVLAALAGCGDEGPSSASDSDLADGKNCGPLTGSIEESKQFTPYASRRGRWPDPILNPTGQKSARLPAQAAINEVAGMPLTWSDVSSDGAAYLYFSDSPLTKRTTLGQFQKAGGVQVEVTDAEVYGVNDIREQVGDRAVAVSVGNSDAIVIWADPNESGIRLHNVYFEANGYLYGVLANASASEAITDARSIACSPFVGG